MFDQDGLKLWTPLDLDGNLEVITCLLICGFQFIILWLLIAVIHEFQVPPDFYIPEFDEDEQNPDERMDRKLNPWILLCCSCCLHTNSFSYDL